jgi:hypothetical protein
VTTRSTPADAENRVRFSLARANLPDNTITHWLAAVRPRLDSAGTYRRSSGEAITTEDVADLILTSEAAKHAPPQAPHGTIPSEHDLAALRARFVALRASQAEQPRTVDQVLDRMRSPLDAIRP